jgi:hypothetical protein
MEQKRKAYGVETGSIAQRVVRLVEEGEGAHLESTARLGERLGTGNGVSADDEAGGDAGSEGRKVESVWGS